MTRKECLEQAMGCVLQDRNNEYGEPENSFDLIADLWTAYTGHVFLGRDVAAMMALLKLARLKRNARHLDSAVDLAGYAACFAECASAKTVPPVSFAPKAEGGCFQNGNGHSPEDPKFKRGDKVEVQMAPDSSTWASAVITAVYRDKDTCEWRYCVDFEDGWAHVVVPSARVRPVSAPKAEGCEALVEKDAPLCGERCEEFIPGLGTCESCRHTREQDAPRTKEELYSKILESNPSTFGCAHKPTGEELAEEEKRG